MSRIKKHYLVQKRNLFNEIRVNNMVLQELRLFSICLSKINKDDVNTRCVRFSITDFQSIMELGRINIDFTIQKNEEFKDPLSLDKFISEREEPIESDEPSVYDERMAFLSDACDNEFTIEEIIVLYGIMLERLSYPEIKDNLHCYKYLFDRYNYMKMRHSKTPITNRFWYMMSIVGCDL